nr:unnamed protein product [Spirometra erinaceieuropaei]
MVLTELLRLKKSESPGPDEIPAKILKELAGELSKPLSMLFHTSFESGYLPPDWKSAWITPLYKGGSWVSANNYRPVSLTSIFSASTSTTSTSTTSTSTSTSTTSTTSTTTTTTTTTSFSRTPPTDGTRSDVQSPSTITTDTPTSGDVNSIHTCPHSDRTFFSHIGLIGHLRIHRRENGEPVSGAPIYTHSTRLNCYHCPRECAHRMGLLGHMRIHENLR